MLQSTSRNRSFDIKRKADSGNWCKVQRKVGDEDAKAKKVLNHFGYNESQFDISDVYTGHRKKTVNEIFEKIALANLLGSDKKVRVTIEYDPNYEDFLLLVTDT